MAISTLPFVLLKTHVMTMPKAMAKMQNFTIARRPLMGRRWTYLTIL
jgi:hypothetical protein